MGVVTGWQGRFFEDYTVGDVYRSRLGRTVTDTDNVWFTNLTLNTNPAHFNTPFGERSPFGKPLVNSAFTPASCHRPLRHRRPGERDGQSRLG
jgi:acyl dehydratase